MQPITNFDIFFNLYERIQKGATLKEVLQDFGGANLYIPSYKSIQRDEDIWKDYKDLKENGATQKYIMLSLQQKYSLSEQHLYKILKTKREPSFF
ncbi:DNA-binding protein [Helicobacter apodemus]|uniref:DNA-binding protein n=1 Tax=Helicobacter apodemus TaxID=135569 RepID=A0A4U8UFT4_9HELI|nr:Mor transcription activator family protein [Helicobacter apodemus]TLE14485.1 DNA-binding protein [Helicobacter apodemus]